ncbi:MAG: DNA translocase FtsK 4TM domain-containing protein, partial [Stellaceae bacterium]
MAKTIPLARGFGQRVNRQVDSWNAMVAAFKRRLWEALGAALVILCFLIAVALVTYNPADPSLNTAGDASPVNFLGRDGAFVADLLIQGFGLAGFLLPLILLGWAFRLLLQRPLQRMPRRLLLVVPALLLGAFACSGLELRPIPLPAGAGGAIGWGLQHVAQVFGL